MCFLPSGIPSSIIRPGFATSLANPSRGDHDHRHAASGQIPHRSAPHRPSPGSSAGGLIKQQHLGFMHSARTMAIRCFCPPDSWLGYASARSARPTSFRLHGFLLCLLRLPALQLDGPQRSDFFITFIWGNRLNCWNTMPTFCRCRSIFTFLSVISVPSNKIWPSVGTSNRFRQRKGTFYRSGRPDDHHHVPFIDLPDRCLAGTSWSPKFFFTFYRRISGPLYLSLTLLPASSPAASRKWLNTTTISQINGSNRHQRGKTHHRYDCG